MKKFFSKAFLKERYTQFREAHPSIFLGIVIGLAVCVVTVVGIFAANAISNLWHSEPIDVEAQQLVISSSNFTEPTTVEVGKWSPFTIRIENPNPSSVPAYESVVTSVTILADSALVSGDVSLICESAIPLTASGDNLVGVLACVGGTFAPETEETYELQVLFNRLGEYVIQIQATGVLGE